jgi:TctA family transporter
MSMMKKKDVEEPTVFLSFIGGINTVNMFVSIITFYTINKARNGSIVALKEILQTITLEKVLLVISSSLFVAGVCVFLGIFISKFFSKLIQRINYKILILSVITLITIISFVFDNFLGLFILLIGTAIGIFTSKMGVAKSYLMGCLLVSVLIYFL